jgi:hypothetical protein
MQKFKYSLLLFGLTSTGVLSDIVNHQVVASEVNSEPSNNFVLTNASDTQIAELQPRNIIPNPTAPELLKEEMFSEVDNADTKPGSISYNAADLQPENQADIKDEITNRPVKSEDFCKNNSNNSDCHQPLASQPNNQDATTPQKSGWAITPEIGTLGIGASVTKSITPNLNARVGVNAASIGVSGYRKRRNEVTYDADLSLLNVSTLLDYHPFKNSGFKITGGLVLNDNKVEGKARIRDNTEFEYNNNRYTSKDIASVKGKVTYPNNIAPYLGIGWGNAVKPGNRWAFSANLGVMFAGSPKANFDADIINDNLRDQINRDLRVEEKELEDDLKGFSIYPVLSLGVSYQF